MKRQRGVALITAILVVALATLSAVAITVSANLALHRANRLQDTEQAWWYAEGVESWVKSILERDARNNQTDSFQDAWAQPLDYLPVDRGFIRGSVTDQQGRFNLNNLGVPDPQQYRRYAEQFERLLGEIEGMDAFAARALAAAIRDWIDPDSDPTGFDGAEDTHYLGLNPPYRSANRPLQSVSELLAIKGMDKQWYPLLLPYLTALPALNTPVNVNTAPEPVLRSMVGQRNPELDRFIARRAEQPAENLEEIQTAFDAQSPPATVRSQFFMLQVEAFIGSGRVALYSFYYRPDEAAPVVLGRSTDHP
jgi:general secretion pathway protein K